ncbi:MAG: hypothetical protein K9W46_03780 [Candidatus Heimdallarchaeum endolithica]|uniref:Uncharacterized protein n=1 Tax=Candidatus Heimdallarchaeum endolithica TaxID=2876572 RepID=A0A9Y1FPY1_9ARCH|nr:MAG: hypothetical protein K9W46_03780 [Candidatus Heimdallarchaeum endolithica]
MAVFISKLGFIIYSLDLKEINGKNSFMSLDKLSRVIADLSQDSSQVIDSLLTEFQRNFIKIIFGNPMYRPKTILIVGEDINKKFEDVKDYLDGEDCEIEISQIIGEGFSVFSENDSIYFLGNRGAILIPQEFTKELEYYSIYYGIKEGITIFIDSFMSRVWELYDQTNEIQKLVDMAVKGNTDALNKVQEEITILSSTISVLGQVKEFLQDSCEQLIVNFDRISDYAFLEIENGLETIKNRVNESSKVIRGLLTELEGKRDHINTLSELQMRKMNKTMTQNTKSMNQVLQANTRTSEAIDMIELILAGSIILEIVAFAIGEISSDQTIYNSIVNKLPLDKDQKATLILFFSSIVAWVILVVYLRISKSRMEKKALRDFIITLNINKKINMTKLEAFLENEEIVMKQVEYDSNNVLITYVWDTSNIKEFNLETIRIVCNKSTELLLSLELETNDMNIDQDKKIKDVMELFKINNILE